MSLSNYNYKKNFHDVSIIIKNENNQIEYLGNKNILCVCPILMQMFLEININNYVLYVDNIKLIDNIIKILDGCYSDQFVSQINDYATDFNKLLALDKLGFIVKIENKNINEKTDIINWKLLSTKNKEYNYHLYPLF